MFKRFLLFCGRNWFFGAMLVFAVVVFLAGIGWLPAEHLESISEEGFGEFRDYYGPVFAQAILLFIAGHLAWKFFKFAKRWLEETKTKGDVNG